ncbi:MAG: putative quinol monooxygenase [Acidimicrobiales bacterium]
MLIIAGTLTVDATQRQAMLDSVAPMVQASRAEAGCHEYVFTPDPHDPSLVRLFEMWESQGALDAHFASDHMAAWQQRAADLPISGRDIAKYTIAEVGPVR